ncbi:MAG: tRNA (adenosine(37)-N6)-threonylcarbamoyltransferase complex ATPase subunit type 1 TsaE [Rubrivivax sp.]|nr:tRNA (adenosine(37)-N6)-threonylcarbamoyltransferase complex ATPase subunit type 1 TsaE [Rubrivivax sp.]
MAAGGDDERGRGTPASAPTLAASAPRADAGAAVARAWVWPDEAACAAQAAALAGRVAARAAVPGPPFSLTIELHGPLGAGKTTFVRHLVRALGVGGRIKSPTYTVVEPYRAGALDIAHFDFYRFADERELGDAGLREMFAAPGLKLVEWATNAGPLRPPADLVLDIEPQEDDSRRVRVHAATARGQELLA